MANLTIKNLPDAMYRQLKKYARMQGRSLNAQVIHILQSDLSEREKFETMRQSNERLERFVASLPPMDDSAPSPMDDSTPLIREDRDRNG